MSRGVSRRLLTASGVGAAVAAAGLGRQPVEAKKCKRSETRTLQISPMGAVTVTPTEVQLRVGVAQVFNSDGTVRYITDPNDLIPTDGDSYELHINGYGVEQEPGTEALEPALDPVLIGIIFKVVGGVLTMIGDKLVLMGAPTAASYADGRALRLRGATVTPTAVIFESALMNSKL